MHQRCAAQNGPCEDVVTSPVSRELNDLRKVVESLHADVDRLAERLHVVLEVPPPQPKTDPGVDYHPESPLVEILKALRESVVRISQQVFDIKGRLTI